MFEITPDPENGLRVVHLINLQTAGDYRPTSIDDLRAVLQAALPELPKSLGACTDAHCRLIDHDNVVKTYYINETMAAKLWALHAFVDQIDSDRDLDLDLSRLPEILNLLAVALESFKSRAQRIQRLKELDEWAQRFRAEHPETAQSEEAADAN